MDNKQSSVDWLIEHYTFADLTAESWEMIKQQAKAMHKQEIETTYDDAVQDMRQDEERPFKGFEYYNNNYEKKKQGRNFDTDAHETFQGG